MDGNYLFTYIIFLILYLSYLIFYLKGLVSKERFNQKKHINNHRSQQVGIIQTEEGIISVEEKSEWSKLRKPADSSHRGQSDLIGGIDTQDHYQTSYQRQINGVNTYQDQLTLVKRAGHRKNIPDPAQASSNSRSQQQMDQYNDFSSSFPSSSSSSHSGLESSINGYSYRPQAMGGSLIKNLGSSLATKMAPPPQQHLSHSNDKTLLVENFNTTPGHYFSLSSFDFF